MRAGIVKRTAASLLACLLAVAPGVRADSDLPNIGDPSANVLTPDQERHLGEGLMRKLRQEGLVIDDPLVQDYVDALGYKLVSNTDRQPFPFTFFVVKAGDINAFAAPGGFIGVNSGLILASRSESELAAVLAHEIAHVTQHHMARSYEAAGRYQWATAVAILAAMLAGKQSGQLAEAAAMTGIAANAQMQINFTRANEEEADRVGIRTLAESGFDPSAMASFFERLQQSARLYGPQLPEFLSTHPVTVSRIADATSRAAQFPHVRVNDSESYHFARSRLRVLTATDGPEIERALAEDLRSGTYGNEDAAHYGYALALLRDAKYDKAREEISRLLKKEPRRIAYLLAAAEIEFKSGNTAKALSMYHNASLVYPNNHPITYYYAQALLQAGKADAARSLLEEYLRTRQPTAAIYNLFARAAGQSGRIAEAYQHMAEYYYLNGQTMAAIDQLKHGLKMKGLDFYQSSQMEARLQQLKAVAQQERAQK